MDKEIEWYRTPISEVFKLAKSSPQGITDEEAAKRLILYGYNEIKEEKKISEILRFLSHFNDPLIYILMVSGLITTFLLRYVDTTIIFLVVLINAVIGYIQERKAKKTIESLKRIIKVKARVIRRVEKEIPAKELVPGDVIVLEAGMKVPADARLFEVKNLTVDESLLTGESTPVEKFSETIQEKTAVERNNMVFAGTLVLEGYGKAVVVATGENTELGKIAKTVKIEKGVETPLLRRIKHISKFIFFIIVVVSILNFIIGVLRGYDPTFMFLASVSLAVAAIPESLPALVTMSLAIGVRDMAKRNAIVRKLPAVESLGSVTTICTDKTGTLTQNKMKVIRIFAGGREYDIESKDSILSREELAEHLDIYLTIKAGYICNTAIYFLKDGEPITSGDPTEVALLEVASLAGIKKQFKIIDEIPFDPALRYMATAVKEGEFVEIYVKGSIERVLSMCRWALAEGKVVELDEHRIHKIASEFALRGLRVLAFAYKFVDLEEFGSIEDNLDDLIFLGLQCMIDPPREECYEAIKKCKEAGVRVIMITGDHPSTALFIAKELDINGSVITGDKIEKMNDEELKKVLKKTNVFARILPKMKLRIVKLLQEMGEIVAVTGDGVNDAPALKRADIGVAMGSGTEVAKESAEIILLDDNFATIVEAIDEGRNVFRKIQKILAWLLPTNVGEGLVVLTAFLLGITLPILPVQILWINTVTAVLLGTTLVFEPREPNLLKLKPITGELLNPAILFRIIWVAIVLVVCAYFLYFRYDENELIARTIAMNTIVFFEIFYLLSSRSIDLSFIKTLKFKNRAIYLGILAMIVLQLVATYSPHFNVILHTAPLDASMWLEIVTVSSLVFLLAELEKYIRINFYKKFLT
ncbi:ATPase, P-type (transporting), HAD superfamily, subfamily IC [Archaeoglobus sulfaticallidus PM70-1]|uniref:ATPase, P-type (Transporting), HAD superfamily, subfamily IC n=1 Tax=Archaeoglobus sulfaticallidus PM70-1 TaxID=387631 RepID=N0BD26_9EURY|nr:HAD-IC family P-type ATPase [Archaeoglobus sulfaticallidus]AGK60918.1 ATPase, P-type (transporting), HAD superfamily, subfamily IC [Archaeoglobus sulfaticallidus PM70-1]